MSRKNNAKDHIGVYEFARETGLSLSFIYQQIYIGKLKAKKSGRSWQIPQSEINAWRKT